MRFILAICGLLAVVILAAILGRLTSGGKSGALKNDVILVIRHGEKPADGDKLSAAGKARAEAYAKYFKNFTLDGQPLKLDYLFAAADSKASRRPRLTLEPTSKALGLAIDSRFADEQFGALADDIRTKLPGKHILLCWHHGEIPQLLQALGADPSQLLPKGKWPDDVFNWVLELRYDSNGRLADAKRITEPF